MVDVTMEDVTMEDVKMVLYGSVALSRSMLMEEMRGRGARARDSERSLLVVVIIVLVEAWLAREDGESVSLGGSICVVVDRKRLGRGLRRESGTCRGSVACNRRCRCITCCCRGGDSASRLMSTSGESGRHGATLFDPCHDGNDQGTLGRITDLFGLLV